MRKLMVVALIAAVIGCGKPENQIKPSTYDVLQDMVNSKKFKQVDGKVAALSVGKLNQPATPIGNCCTGYLHFGGQQQAGGFSPPAFASGGQYVVTPVSNTPLNNPPGLYPIMERNQQTGETRLKEYVSVPIKHQTDGNGIALSTAGAAQPPSAETVVPLQEEVITSSTGPASVIIHNHIHNYPTRDNAGDDLDDIGVSMSTRRRSNDFELFKALLMASPNQVYRNLWHTIQDWRQLRQGENINEAAPGLHGESITTGPGGAAYQIFWREGVTQYAWFRRNDR